MTKGVWVWGEPREVTVAGETVSLLYIDTEGFEGTGQADVYDDRIFALSVLVSSTLVYNLPETVREADIEKLSFASQLADEFYKRNQGRDKSLQLASLLWLIQRDFLEGKTVQQLVDKSLEEVANPSNDKHVAGVNKVREALRRVHSHKAFGLRQPHLERTKLCDLPETSLDAGYRKQMTELRDLVVQMTKPKAIGGRHLTGPQFAEYFEKAVNAINAGDIPSPSGIIESFNANVLQSSVAAFREALDRVKLPVSEDQLIHAKTQGIKEALQSLQRQSFGESVTEEELHSLLIKEYNTVRDRNLMQSQQLCEKLGLACSDGLEAVVNAMRIPSRTKFVAEFRHCNASYEQGCVGPSKEMYRERLRKAYNRELGSFMRDYKHKLLGGLTGLSLVGILVARFVVVSGLMELLCWLSFAVLEVAPKLSLFGQEDITQKEWWGHVVTTYEALVYNPLFDLDGDLTLVLVVLLVSAIWLRRRRKRTEADPDDKVS